MHSTNLSFSIARGFSGTGSRLDSVVATFARAWFFRVFALVLVNSTTVLKLLIVAMSSFSIEPAGCHAQQPANAPAAATALAENPLAAEFKMCDANGDGALTEAEYLKRVGREMPVLLREFKVFDIDSDGRMSLAEFVTVPVGQPEEFRGVIADPVVLISEMKLARLTV